MTVQAWPNTIPAPSNEFDSALFDAAARTGELFGEKNVRRRMMKGTASANLSFVMTETEKAEFELFYLSTCNTGAAWFTASWLAYLGFATHQGRIMERSLELVTLSVWNITVTLELRDVSAN